MWNTTKSKSSRVKMAFSSPPPSHSKTHLYTCCRQGRVLQLLSRFHIWFKLHSADQTSPFLFDGSPHLLNCLRRAIQQNPFKSVLTLCIWMQDELADGDLSNLYKGEIIVVRWQSHLWKQQRLWAALSQQWQLLAHLYKEMVASTNMHNL